MQSKNYNVVSISINTVGTITISITTTNFHRSTRLGSSSTTIDYFVSSDCFFCMLRYHLLITDM